MQHSLTSGKNSVSLVAFGLARRRFGLRRRNLWRLLGAVVASLSIDIWPRIPARIADGDGPTIEGTEYMAAAGESIEK
ncbi:MAG: hypothetical protein ACOY5F_08140, partial [Pseudomonadota bacterium]